MNTHEIEKTREALIRQWNRSYRQPWIVRQLHSRQVQIVLLVVLSSLTVGAIPILYGLTLKPQALAVNPTQAGIWEALSKQD